MAEKCEKDLQGVKKKPTKNPHQNPRLGEQPVSDKVTLQQALKSWDEAARTQLVVSCQEITPKTEQHPHLSGDFNRESQQLKSPEKMWDWVALFSLPPPSIVVPGQQSQGQLAQKTLFSRQNDSRRRK